MRSTHICADSCLALIERLYGTLRWRHNELDGVSEHQPHDCLLNLLFRRRSKKTSKLRVTGLCAGKSPWTGEFSAQKASNAENVSIWWRHDKIETVSRNLNVGRIHSHVRRLVAFQHRKMHVLLLNTHLRKIIRVKITSKWKFLIAVHMKML